MKLIDRRATSYEINPNRHGDGYRLVCWFGPYATAEAAQADVDDLNALHEQGVREGIAAALARLRARGAGYAALADEIEQELGISQPEQGA